LNNLANAYCGIGDYDLAQETIGKAIMLRPNYRQAYLTSARINEAVGNFSEALERLNKAKSLSTETGFIDRGRSNLKTMLSLVSEGFKPLDKIYLKNGRSLVGVIKEEDEGRLVLEVTAGNSIGNVILYAKDIDRIIRAGKKKQDGGAIY